MEECQLTIFVEADARTVAFDDRTSHYDKLTLDIGTGSRKIASNVFRCRPFMPARYADAITFCKHHRLGTAFKYAAMASRSLFGRCARLRWTSAIDPPTVSKSGVKPVSR